jgi:hypothetical protein
LTIVKTDDISLTPFLVTKESLSFKFRGAEASLHGLRTSGAQNVFRSGLEVRNESARTSGGSWLSELIHHSSKVMTP